MLYLRKILLRTTNGNNLFCVIFLSVSVLCPLNMFPLSSISSTSSAAYRLLFASDTSTLCIDQSSVSIFIFFFFQQAIYKRFCFITYLFKFSDSAPNWKRTWNDMNVTNRGVPKQHHRHQLPPTKFTMINSSYHCYFFGLATLSFQPLTTAKRGALYGLLSYFHSVWILVDLLCIYIWGAYNGIVRVEIFSHSKFKSNWSMKLEPYSLPMETKNHWNLSFILCSVSTHLRGQF